MNEQKEKSYLVTEIEFDYDEVNNDEVGYAISFDDEIRNRDTALGVWFAYDDEHLIDRISETVGYCIKSISFEPNRPHALTSYM